MRNILLAGGVLGLALSGGAAPAPAPPPVIASPAAAPLAAYAERVPGLRPYEPMGASYEDALASDLPGIALRIPNTQTEGHQG